MRVVPCDSVVAVREESASAPAVQRASASAVVGLAVPARDAAGSVAPRLGARVPRARQRCSCLQVLSGREPRLEQVDQHLGDAVDGPAKALLGRVRPPICR
jgi:hypothetical protein